MRSSVAVLLLAASATAARTAEEQQVGKCLDGVVEIQVCDVGGASAECCSALLALEHRGCFLCGPALSALRAYAGRDVVDSLAAAVRSCRHAPAFDAEACPAADRAGVCGVAAATLREARIETIQAFVGFTRPRTDEEFSLADIDGGLRELVSAEGFRAVAPGAGTFRGADGLVEFVLLGHAQVTGGLIAADAGFAGAWTFEGDRAASASGARARMPFDPSAPPVDLRFVTEYEFEACGAKLTLVHVVADMELMALVSRAARAPEWNATFRCGVHGEHCGGALAQFPDEAACVRAHAALPTRACDARAHYAEGPAAACAFRRARGGKRVIQVRFNTSVSRAIIPEKGSMRRERSER